MTRPVVRAAAVLAIAMLPMGTQAQERPDFSGQWTVDTGGGRGGGRGGGPAASGSGWGPSFSIVQRSDSLIVERAFFSPGDLQPRMKFRYALSGSESTNSVLMGRGFQEQRSTAKWEGDRLVITVGHTDSMADGGRGVNSEVRHTLSYQRAGREAHPPLLVVETWRGGAMGGTATTTRTVYVRS